MSSQQAEVSPPLGFTHMGRARTVVHVRRAPLPNPGKYFPRRADPRPPENIGPYTPARDSRMAEGDQTLR